MDIALANGLVAVIQFITNILQLLVIASIVVSFVGDRNNPIVQVIESITEPMYAPFKKITRHIPGPLDWSPILLLAIILFVSRPFFLYWTTSN